VQKISTGKTVKISRRPGVFPKELKRLEEKVKKGHASPAEITKTRDQDPTLTEADKKHIQEEIDKLEKEMDME